MEGSNKVERKELSAIGLYARSSVLMGVKMEIHYVEDDRNIAQTVREYLEQKNCSVYIYSTIAEAKKRLQVHIPDLILIDWNMPDGQGDVLCKWIRTKWKELPIIFLTVHDDSQDIISGLQNGADDYVVKPFELGILYSRICALMRRAGKAAEQSYFCDAICIDQNRKMVFYKEEEINLSLTEYRLLLLLMNHKGKTVTRECLLEHIWDYSGNYVNDNTLTVTMKRLREKLHQPSCLKTIRSFGYRLEDTI